MSYLLAFAGFATLIVLHELGHFIAAKSVGMRVERFALFFPPLLLRRKFGETEYAVGAVPLGGYVKITGMNHQEEIDPQLLPRSYYRQPVWKRVTVIAAGPAMNVMVALALLFSFYMFALSRPVPIVDSTEAASPAAGKLLPGDRIVSIDGRAGDPAELRRQLITHSCAGKQINGCRARTPAELVALRNGRELKLTIYPHYDALVDPPSPRLGFRYRQQHYSVGPLRAAQYSIEGAWHITKGTFVAVGRVFTPEGRKQISGVVGGYKATEESFATQLSEAVLVLAVISLSLAVVNLFPFLPLDGGHILFAMVERVRGRAVSYLVMERASVLGFMLVIFLFLVGLSNDIGRLTSGQEFIPK